MAEIARFGGNLALTGAGKTAPFPPLAQRDGVSGQTGRASRKLSIPKIDNKGVCNPMNKNELIGTVADTSGLSRNDATKAVEGVFDAISAALAKGDEVRLVGFGTFSVAKRKASTGRNPRTGEPMTIKASTQPKFKAGKGLKDAVN
ncbi:nucleoid DNA-binding protein [Croceicoccus sp. BE223]|nr:nucleoid DNA-binding protein [Croceicoccus sp. BE223]